MVKGKHVLILAASITTGYTVQAAVEAVNYYGGMVAGLSAIFATTHECLGYPVISIFDPASLPDYASYDSRDCLCARPASTSTPWSTALAIRHCKEAPNTKASAEASADAFCLPGAPGHCFLGNTKGLQRYTATRYRAIKHQITGSHRITAL